MAISLKKTAMFWNTENHFLFEGLFDWENTKTFFVYQKEDGSALAESQTRKSSTVTPLLIMFNIATSV